MRTSTFLLLFNNSTDEDDMAIPKRLMLFIDGENLVMRYQNMITKGCIPINGSNIKYKKDIYIWATNIPLPNPNPKITNIDIVRAHYYTSVSGDMKKQIDIENEIKSINLPKISAHGNPQVLFPVVYKKNRQQEKAKGVDIRMAIDILSHTYNNNLDTVCFFSGDGDFEPVLKEVMGQGKNILLYSFSSGLNPALSRVCDEYICLDSTFFLQ
jgi:uncharacterized LabA/DUF88 family protein